MIAHDHEPEFCATCWRWDPLTRIRSEADPALDVITTGMVFFDLIFTGLSRLPRPARSSGAPEWGPALAA